MAKGKNVIGAWAFLIGVILALIIGLIGLSATWITVLLVLGILIGLLNVGGTELKDFMLAGTVLVIVGSLGGQALYNLTIANISIGAVFPALVALFVPATIVVALKAVFAMAKK
ncbi:MAG: hypothetical protein ABIG37_01960 [Nanoarchaeota archaeon]|nr:hypothetical protein [Nanoarchaeota archaeon]